VNYERLRRPWRIAGWLGEHDEAGAVISDADGKHVAMTLGGLREASPLADWARYHEVPMTIVTAVNSLGREDDIIALVREFVDADRQRDGHYGRDTADFMLRHLLSRLSVELDRYDLS